MTSPMVLLALFLCMAAFVQVSLQEKEEQGLLEKRKALLTFLEGLESSLKHQEQVKREMELEKRRQAEIKRVKAELSKLKEEEDKRIKKKIKKSAAVISDLDGGKRACGNRLSAGKCQLLRWFGKGCSGKKMIVNCRASCGLC